jgi:hypothetical protein
VAPRDPVWVAVAVIGKVLRRAGPEPGDIAQWETDEAFASVPIAACREYGLDEELVNYSESGCCLGHPIAASGPGWSRHCSTNCCAAAGSERRRCAPAAVGARGDLRGLIKRAAPASV